jgi:hypothetical protein
LVGRSKLKKRNPPVPKFSHDDRQTGIDLDLKNQRLPLFDLNRGQRGSKAMVPVEEEYEEDKEENP